MENAVVEILTYQPEHQRWFEKLNRNWIEKYFWMEPVDFEVLQHPDENIVNHGGTIFMGTYNKEIAGTAAVKFVEPGVYEFTKMAVDEKFQGKNVEYHENGQAKDVFFYKDGIPTGEYYSYDLEGVLILSQPAKA